MRDMHEQRSHTDVKPANIMLSWQDGPLQIWLVDFASSRLHQEGEHSAASICPVTAHIYMLSMSLLCTNKQIKAVYVVQAMSAQECLPSCLFVCLRAVLAWHACLLVISRCVSISEIQRSVSAEHLRNGAYTASYASPQLIQHMGSGQMPAMNDVANDIWALGAVLFELSVSAESSWRSSHVWSQT